MKGSNIDGDLSIGRNVATGGSLTTQGDAYIKGSAKITGWLDAENIKGANKGLFASEEKLKEAYPEPLAGWWAIVGETLPGDVYIVNDGQWVATGEKSENIYIDDEQFREQLNELHELLRGTSEYSSAVTDPFKFLGEFDDPNSSELLTALDTLHSNDPMDGYEGVWRFTVRGKPSTLYNFAMSHTADKWVQGLITVYCPNSNPDYVFGVDFKAHFLYRYYNGETWGKWSDATLENQHLINEQNSRVTAVENSKKAKRNFVRVDADSATIIAKYNDYWDIVIRFAKVLANDLYSIERVYLAENHGKELSTEISEEQYLLCEQTRSDMIGPVQVKLSTGSNAWVGGNHLYGTLKSAETSAVSIFADGKDISGGGSVYADVVIIKVENTIFDPAVAPVNGKLSSPLIKESVAYKVANGEIHVSVQHCYMKDTHVNVYYGQQSMFVPRVNSDGETVNVQFITAQGGCPDWTMQPLGSESVHIKKSEAAGLNRFSQKHENGHYQNTVLLPYGLGSHEYVADDGNVFVYTGNKAYHVLIQNKDIASGAALSWMGVYNWHRPIVDDDYNYIYDYCDLQSSRISVTAKKAYNNIVVPAPVYAVNSLFIPKEKTDVITVAESITSYMLLSATGQSSISGVVAHDNVHKDVLQLSWGVENEISRAMAAEQQLQTIISGVAQQQSQDKTSLQNSIISERMRAEVAELQLQRNIDAIYKSVYLTKEEYEQLVKDGLIKDDIEYNIYEDE